jgi:methylamine--corrinoid protein Co-methyltransferase
MAAYYLLGILLFQGTYHLTGPVHFNYGCSTTRDSLWVLSVVGRAASRNTRYPAIALGYAAAGLCTKMYFYEAAAFVLSCVPSGYGSVQTVHPGKAVIDDGVTPLEARFCAELAHAITGMKADHANDLVNRLLEKYEKEVEDAPSGKRYQECFDTKTGKPSDDYQRLYEEVKDELTSLGITLQ